MNRREIVEDIVAHGLAAVITLGFFTVILVTLLGFVDLKDATVTSLVGLVIGYVAGSLNAVLGRYFKDAGVVQVRPDDLSLKPLGESQTRKPGTKLPPE